MTRQQGERTKVLLAQFPLETHSRGIITVAGMLRDAGMEVVYLGLRLNPEEIADAAIQEDVDVVGLSCLSGAHMSLFPKTVDLIREKGGQDIIIVGGGIIPEKDVPKLLQAGMARVFGPGTPLSDIADFIQTAMAGRG